MSIRIAFLGLLAQAIVCSAPVIAQYEHAAAIDRIFANWDSDNAPGCALGIIQNGKLVYSRGYGMANLEYGIPNSRESVFRIGSTSKQFTAACIVLLSQEGKLNLDDPLSKFFPDFPSYADNITVLHLLNHTSGIRDYLQLAHLKGLSENDWYSDEDVMKWLINQTDLNFKPGAEFIYSNSGYWLLGQIVEAASGMNMADYAKEKIFKPLGMNHTHFHNDHTTIVKNRASGYAPNGSGGYQISMTTLDMIGDGGIFTSIEDILIWDKAFYSSETLNENFWDTMTDQGVLNNGDAINYAAGLFVSDYKGLRTISHGGAFVGFRAELLRFPTERTSIAIFANRADANPQSMAKQVANIVLADKLVESTDAPGRNKKPMDQRAKRKQPIEISAAELAEYSGFYYSSELQATYRLATEDDKLYLTVGAWKNLECSAAEIDVVACSLGKIKFKREDGAVTGFELDSGRVLNVRFEKTEQ